MTEKNKTPPIWTKEDRERHKAVREQFQRDRPSLDALVASGEYVGPLRHDAYLNFLQAMRALKMERERQGLSLSDISERSGIDPAAISRLENGKQANPTIDTILRYADALGKQLVWAFQDARSAAPKPDDLSGKRTTPTLSPNEVPMSSERNFVERAATRELAYRGFIRTTGRCARCGEEPRGTHCLHGVFDPSRNELLEYGSVCFPDHIVPALVQASEVEPDPARKRMMQLNLARIRARVPTLNKRRRQILLAPRPAGEKQTALLPSECVAGGYEFVLQRIGDNTFTVRVYDDELADVAKHICKHVAGESDESMSDLSQADLVELGEWFRATAMDALEVQDAPDYKIFRYPMDRLAPAQQAARAVCPALNRDELERRVSAARQRARGEPQTTATGTQ